MKISRPATRRKPPIRQTVRQDGQETRQQLLEAAGQVFAEHGYAKATSKEICERARANIAAVNYHFGGKDGLYAAVLEEAHRRLISIETLTAAAQSELDPRAKLQVFIGCVVREISRRDTAAWELRVLSRELLSQSALIERMIVNQVQPKARILAGVVAEIMQLPVEHAAIGRTLVNVVGPCLFLLITQHRLQQRILPGLDLSPEQLTEHMVSYALAGMQAVAREVRSVAGKRNA